MGTCPAEYLLMSFVASVEITDSDHRLFQHILTDRLSASEDDHPHPSLTFIWFQTIGETLNVFKRKHAGMAELADALDSGSSGCKLVQVQVLFPAPIKSPG
jgi:hypothetical protein